MRRSKTISCLLLVLFLTAMMNGGVGIPVAMADPPSIPSNITAVTSSTSQINVSWSDNSSEETGYILERTQGSSKAEIPLPANTTSYSDSGLLESTSYSYRVKAVKDSESSAYCGPVSATTWGVPAAPSNLSLLQKTASQVQITWSDNSSNESKFVIKRKTTDSFVEIGVVNENQTTYTDSTVSSGTAYTYVVYAANSFGDAASNELAVTTPDATPSAPTGLAFNSVTSTSLNLTWNDASSNEQGFRVYRKTGSSSFSKIGSDLAANTTSYADSGLSAGTTYTYKVAAYNAVGSTDSAEITVTTGTAKPAAPTSLSATAASSSSITLHWIDNATDETGYKVERKTGSSGTYTQVASPGANVSSFTDSNLTAATTYYYRVKAYNAGGDSNYSTEAYATTSSSKVPNAAPYNLKATNLSSTSIKLTWSEYSNNETGFYIERKKTSSGTWSQIGTVGANVVTYTNTGLSEKTTYYYRVRAYNSSGYSDYSETISIITANPSEVPEAPSGLSITVSSGKISLTWKDNSDNEDGFKIYRKASDETSYKLVKTVSAGVKSWSDTDVYEGITYYYKVYAYNDSGSSDYVSASGSLASNNIPSPPSSLSATVLTTNSVQLTWTDNSSNESGFKIERKEKGGTYSQIATVGASVKTYTDTGLSPNTTYYYRVRAYNSYGNSDYSSEKSVTTTGQSLAAPTGLTGYSSGLSVSLSWTDNASGETGFKIERKTASSGTYSEIGNVSANITRYTDTAVSASNTYYYRVRAYASSQYSGYSNEAPITVTGILPTGSKTLQFYIGNKTYLINGIQSDMDSAAIIKNGRTLLPIRYVGNTLGATVDWTEVDQKVTITLESKKIELWIGKSQARVNGINKLIDPNNSQVTPIIISGRTMLPIRFISENLGCQVEWNKDRQEVMITY